jgi:Xaa-Pro aminopeptidase
VHEGPQNISLTGHGAKLARGMVVSNEPGFYLPGEFGIRIENLMWVSGASSLHNNRHCESPKEVAPSLRAIEDGVAIPGGYTFLQFCMLTLVPYEKSLIDFSLLSDKEIAYISSYYHKIEQKILPHLSPAAGEWLKGQLEISNSHGDWAQATVAIPGDLV